MQFIINKNNFSLNKRHISDVHGVKHAERLCQLRIIESVRKKIKKNKKESIMKNADSCDREQWHPLGVVNKYYVTTAYWY